MTEPKTLFAVFQDEHNMLVSRVAELTRAIQQHKETTTMRTPEKLRKKPARWSTWSLSEISQSEWGHATSADYKLWAVLEND